MKTTIKATCSFCGRSHELNVWPGINIAEEPDLKAKVKDGSLFIWECPGCCKANLASYQTIYHDPAERIMVWMLPEGLIPEDKVEAIGRQIEASSDQTGEYVFRRVGDIGSLIEKVNIFDAGLDDRIIELCKYVTRMELAEKGGNKEIMDAPLKFYRMDGPDNDLEFSYPLDGKMLGVRIGFNVYGDCAGIIRRNPSMKPSGGFLRIDRDWVEGHFV